MTTKEGKPDASASAKPKPQQTQPKLQPRQPMKEVKIIRIAESDLDGDKRLEHGLTKIKGISWAYAHAIRKVLGFENKKVAELSEEEINKIREVLRNPQNSGIPSWLYNRQFDPVTGKSTHILSSELVLTGKMDVKRLKTIRCYRGVRHSFGYKVRGQRTRSRGANVKGRVGGTVGVIKKKLVPQKAGEKEEKK